MLGICECGHSHAQHEHIMPGNQRKLGACLSQKDRFICPCQDYEENPRKTSPRKREKLSVKKVLMAAEHFHDALLDPNKRIDDDLIQGVAEYIAVTADMLYRQHKKGKVLFRMLQDKNAEIEEMRPFVGRRAAIRATKAKEA